MSLKTDRLLGKETVCDPWQQPLDTGTARVVRGGSWYNLGGFVRSAFHFRRSPDYRNSVLGFRLALGHSGSGLGSGTTGQETATGVDPGRRVAEQRQTVVRHG